MKTLSRSAYPRKHKLNFRSKRESGENFLQRQLSIYRGEGAVSGTRLDPTVVRFPDNACPLRRSEGDVFHRISKFFVESDHRSQPASPEGPLLGNSEKIYHPQNVGFDEIHEISF
jgi:hypothetical protein